MLSSRNGTGTATSRSERQWRSDILGATCNGNRLSRRVYEGRRFWLAELPALDVMTQGRTTDGACTMVKDMLETLVNLPGFSVQVDPDEDGAFEVTF